MSDAHRLPTAASSARPTPATFSCAADAWLWTMSILRARIMGGAAPAAAVTPCCEPDDVVKVLDRLHRERRIDLQHAHILRIWGERGTAPRADIAEQRGDHSIWAEAMERMEWPLRVKGIVQRPMMAGAVVAS